LARDIFFDVPVDKGRQHRQIEARSLGRWWSDALSISREWLEQYRSHQMNDFSPTTTSDCCVFLRFA
jgi:hypothetical protein